MVFPHGPGKFYGSSLPRPRIYTDVKFNHERVDPPVSVVDPLLSWAHEAHWSMGGLSTKRLRLQGRIEGNISKLRAENEKLTRKMIRTSSVPETEFQQSDRDEPRSSDSPPPAPVAANKKRRFLALIEEEEEEEHEEVTASERKRPARKLINEFNSVATTATRRSPRSDNKSDPPKSRGGSFVSKMQKASENVMMMKHSKKSTPTSESESSDEEGRTKAKLKKMKSASGSPRLVRTSPRRMKKKL